MELIKECPACEATTHNFVRNCKDFTVSSDIFSIVQCTACSLLFTNPRPDPQEISKYYESKEYISHSNTNKGIVNKIYQLVRVYSIQNKIKLITRLIQANEKSILDIGCGTGEFLGTCKKAGWKTTGIEPNEGARQQAISNFKLNVQSESYLNIIKSEDRPMIISMWHVLEHVHDLRGRLEQVASLIQKNGFFIVAVPNPNSWDALHYQDYWAAYDLPRHLYHFSPIVLKKLISSFGFTHIESLPMPFDSFYVSMLSEKYKHQGSNNIKAILNGLRSNLNSRAEAENYSSVIYIFKK